MAIQKQMTFEGLATGAATASGINTNSGGYFSSIQQAASGRCQIIGSPVGEGTRAMSTTVQQGDVAASGARCELCCGTITSDSTPTERWFRFLVRFPSGLYTPSPGSSFNIFAQLHPNTSTGQPNAAFKIDTRPLSGVVGGNRPLLVTYGGTVTTADPAPNQRLFPLASSWAYDHWYEYVLGVNLAADSTGWVNVFIDQQEVLPKTFTPTTYTGTGVYQKIGYYWDDPGGSTTVYYDSVSFATVKTDYITSAPADPTLTITQNITNGQTLTGTYAWRATVTGGIPTRVEFYADSALLLTETSAPYGDTVGFYDTTTLANGNHTLQSIAYNDAGTAFSVSATASVQNAQPPTITTTTLPDGSPTQAYSQTLQATGGTQPFTWTLA